MGIDDAVARDAARPGDDSRVWSAPAPPRESAGRAGGERAAWSDDPSAAGDVAVDDLPREDEQRGAGSRWDANAGGFLPVGMITGTTVVDPEGDRVGKVADVYLDSGTGAARYLAIATGVFGGRHLVPYDDARMALRDDDLELTVPYTRDQLKDAPRIGTDEHLDADGDERLRRWYADIDEHDARRESLRARQSTPAPTPAIAAAQAAADVPRTDPPRGSRG